MRMNAQERAYFELLWRGYRSYRIVDLRSGMYGAAVMLLLLLTSLYFLGNGFSIESVFALGAIIAGGLSGAIALVQCYSLQENKFREWWLTFPLSRAQLLRIRLLAVLRMNFYLAGGLWIVCIGHALFKAGNEESFEYISASRVLADILSYACLYAMAVVLGTLIGYSVMAMYNGWRRLLLVPLVLLGVLPFILQAVVTNSDSDAEPYLQADRVFLYSGIALVLAAVIYQGATAFILKYGMRDLAKYRSGAGASGFKQARSQSGKIRFQTRRSGIAAVYALERARFRNFASLSTVRIVAGVLFLIAATAGFFGVSGSRNMLQILQTGFTLSLLAASTILSTINGLEANKNRLEWWLCLPYKRTSILLARMAAIAVSVARWAGSLLLAAAIGAGLGWNRIPPGAYVWDRDAPFIMFMIVLFFGGGLILFFLISGQSYMYKNTFYAWIFVPVQSCIYFLPLLLNQWVFTDSLWEHGISDKFWSWSVAAEVVGAGIALYAFLQGAKHLYLYAYNTQTALNRKRALKDNKLQA